MNKGGLVLEEDEILGFLERRVTPFGNSAKMGCPKKYIGKRVYLMVSRNDLSKL